MLNKIKIIFITSLLLFLVLPLPMWAATLYLDPVNAKIGPNDVFEVKVKIGVAKEEKCINVAEIGLEFSTDVLEMRDFSIGESIFSLWIKKPDKDSLATINKEGKIYFIGGIPGGYCGRIPGDSGESNILGTIIFAVKKPVIFHKTEINFLSSSKILLNNGVGSEALVQMQNASLEVDETKTGEKDIWELKKREDITPPEAFVIEISKASNIFDNKYFIAFSTMDKQTGIDHFEVLEDNPGRVIKILKKDNFLIKKIRDIFGNKKEELSWEKVKSPYLLKDQDLNSVIMIKAIDNSGNEMISEYQNDALERIKDIKEDYLFIYIISVIFVFLFLIIFIIKKVKGDKYNLK